MSRRVVEKKHRGAERRASAIARTSCFDHGRSGGGKVWWWATGGDTELGHINQDDGGEKHRTPLLVQMDKLGKAIFIIIP